MNEKKAEILKKASAFSRGFREIVLEADPKDLEEAIAGEGEDPQKLAETGRTIVAQALRRNQMQVRAEEQEQVEAEALREGLSALIQLLRRREGLSEEDLAKTARVDVNEIRRIEVDWSYTPSPRTIFQLEQVFRLPSRTLVLLSGAKKRTRPDFTDEVMRFAANAKTMGRLNSAEMKLLNEFVNFLSSQERDLDKE